MNQSDILESSVVSLPPGIGEAHLTLDDLQYLRICGTCRALYEADRPDGMNQRCHCQPDDEALWKGKDFNERASLCLCCGTEVLLSGSRWAPYFCRECQLLSMGVSIWCRHLVFPIGRHSVMHTFVPGPPSPTLAGHGGGERDLAEAVSATTMAVFKGSVGLRQWSAIVVSRNLRRLRLRGGTRLTDYLAAIEKKEGAFSRWEAFAGLCAFFQRPDTGDERRALAGKRAAQGRTGRAAKSSRNRKSRARPGRLPRRKA